MTDDEFLHAFFSLSLPPSAFRHRDHVRLAWLVVRRRGAAAAEPVVGEAIRRFAAGHGQGDRYHETLTAFWVRLVAHAVQDGADIDDFDGFLHAYPLLLDPQLPLRHWSRNALFARAARASWQKPDIIPLSF